MGAGNPDAGALAITNPQWKASPQRVSTSTTAAENSTILQPGLYRIICTVETFFLQGAVTVTADANDHRLPADAREYVSVKDPVNDGYISFILASGTGTAEISGPL